jgi:cytochrome c oxidase cbb3-type subunit 2
MSKSKFIRVWVGFLGTFLTAWVGLVILPVLNLGRVEALSVPESAEVLTGSEELELVNLGRRVYVDYGCIYCHSQQIRPERAGSDMKMGWGDRRTYPQDYANDKVALMGTMRTGPDLSNIGIRQSSEVWHLVHLYNPQITSAGSIMPPYPFLFEERKIDGQPSENALQLSGEFAPPEGYEVVPTREAEALVAYLLSLRKSESPAPADSDDHG